MAGVRSRIDRLRRAMSRDGRPARALDLPCSVCGASAVGWGVDDSMRNGVQVIDGIALCAEHLTEAEELPRSKAG